MNKVIYLVTTDNCSACKCQKLLLTLALKQRKDIELKICDFKEVPDSIVEQIKLEDFPTTVLTKDNKVVTHIVGTTQITRFRRILDDIKY